MLMSVPYLHEEQIERDAEHLLARHAHARSVIITPPIPIEDIVEKHLGLGLEFDDTHRRFGVPRERDDPDILGAIFFEQRQILIDESLDPEMFPARETRFRFTLAHESGHWCLHRDLFMKAAGQGSLFDAVSPPSAICRSSQRKEPVEWQANFFASCLLMPRRLLFAAWRQAKRSDQPFVCEPEGATNRPDAGRLFDAIARDFAPSFGVSVQAMRIRLEQLGLLLREPSRQRVFNAGD